MSAFRNHQGSTFTEKGRNKLNYRIGPLRSDSVIKLVSYLITESDQAVRAVHSCNSWLETVLLALFFSLFHISFKLRLSSTFGSMAIASHSDVFMPKTTRILDSYSACLKSRY